MKKFYAIINTVVILAVIFWNYWSNTGVINGKTVGELSNEYANLFTPAGYAFAIWGLIFLSLIALGFNQIKLAFFGGKHTETILQIGPWLIITNLGNAAWLWFWLNDQTGISVIVMIVMLIALIQIILRLDMERWDAPASVIAFVWWPICAYSGWIAVATIANIAAYLAKIGWAEVFSELHWTLIMVSLAGIVNLVVLRMRSMREFAAIGVWALVAIAVRHWGEIPLIQWTSVFWSVVLVVAILEQGFRNRRTNPFWQMITQSK